MQSNGFLRQLQITFVAFLIAQTMFAFILYFFIKIPVQEAGENMLSTILPLVMIATLVAGYYLFNMRRSSLTSISHIDDKKMQYRSASLIKWAMFEGVTLFALVYFMVTGVSNFFYIGIASLVHFALHFPSQERVSRELESDDLS